MGGGLRPRNGSRGPPPALRLADGSFLAWVSAEDVGDFTDLGGFRDRVGNLWVAEYRVLDEPSRWQIFDPSGRWLGELTLPDGGRITEIGDDYVLGVWRDEAEVETVRLYGLRKPGRD